MLIDYGPYASVFERGELAVPGHLPILHCTEDDAGVVLARVQEALVLDPDYQHVARLFAAKNWRPNLVGCVAALLSDAIQPFPEMIWRAFDNGSWVSPQLAVTAHLKDPAFADQAKRRLVKLCPTSFVVDAWTPELHSAMGPGSAFDRSAQGIACLVELLSLYPADATWLEVYRQSPDVMAIIKQDRDNSARLAADWRHCVLQQLAKHRQRCTGSKLE